MIVLFFGFVQTITLLILLLFLLVSKKKKIERLNIFVKLFLLFFRLWILSKLVRLNSIFECIKNILNARRLLERKNSCIRLKISLSFIWFFLGENVEIKYL